MLIGVRLATITKLTMVTFTAMSIVWKEPNWAAITISTEER